MSKNEFFPKKKEDKKEKKEKKKRKRKYGRNRLKIFLKKIEKN